MSVPPIIINLVADLRDRRLLPVVIGLVVAIIAVPFLLGGGGQGPVAETSSSAALAGEGRPAPPSRSSWRRSRTSAPTASASRPTRRRTPSSQSRSLRTPNRRSGAQTRRVSSIPVSRRSRAVCRPQPTRRRHPRRIQRRLRHQIPTLTLTLIPPDPTRTQDPAPEPKLLTPVVDVAVGPERQVEGMRRVNLGDYLPNRADPIAQYVEGSLNGKNATFLLSPAARSFEGDGRCEPDRTKCKCDRPRAWRDRPHLRRDRHPLHAQAGRDTGDRDLEEGSRRPRLRAGIPDEAEAGLRDTAHHDQPAAEPLRPIVRLTCALHGALRLRHRR